MHAIKPLKIIIFEDESLLANDLRHQIEKYNYKVIAMFRKGEDGLKYLEKVEAPEDIPDIVLMDISLAGSMSGIETAEIIVGKCNCAVVFLTGISQLDTFEEAFAIKPHAFLIKPFDAQQALVSIRLALYQKSLENRIAAYREQFGELSA
jgi:DNA-binding NarL/FixJ family response regulator